MANIRINQNRNNSTGNIKINKDVEPEPIKYEEPVEKPREPDFVKELPTVEVDIKPPTPEPVDDIDTGTKKSKNKKNKGSKRNKKSKNTEDTPLNVEQAYKSYRKRKIAVFLTFILVAVFIVGFGAFNVFFKHQLTPQEAAEYTNQMNKQSVAQSWDSGVQSFLQRNLKDIMKKSFQATSATKDFDVSNISVEKNQPFGDNTFLTFFSCDLTANGTTERVFCNIFIDVSEGKYKATSPVNITARKAYSADGEVSKENQYLDFQEDTLNQQQTKDFKAVLENFLTLGYNSKQDVSNIYKGRSELSFNGTFKSIDKIGVYDKPNELGYNAYAIYTIELGSGISYQNKCYMKIEKNSSGSYVIDMIL